MNWLHIHWYRVTANEPMPITTGWMTFVAQKRVKQCRCGAAKVRIRGSL